jgi:hypothetical protein
MTDARFVPNSFQTPNIHVDAVMELVTGDEYKVLDFATRHILGWRENISSREADISLSRFEKGFVDKSGQRYGGCGLSRPALVTILDDLVRFGLLVKVGKPGKTGQRWRLGDSPDWAALESRRNLKKTANQKRTSEARQKRPRKTPQAAHVVSAINQSAVNPTNHPAVNGTNQPAVSPTNQQRLVPLTDSGKSDLPKQTQQQTHQQTQIENPSAAAEAADNIFALYEKAFGEAEFAKAMKSEMLRDELKDMQAEYPADWIEAVFKDAAMHHPKYPISYCLKILKDKAAEQARQEAAVEALQSNGHHQPSEPKPAYVPPAGLEDEYGWWATMNQLEAQLDRNSFDAWLRDTEFVTVERDVPATDPDIKSETVTRFTISARNEYAVLNLQLRLYRTVRRVLRDIYGSPVEIVFIEKQNAPIQAGHLEPAGNLPAQ